MQIYHLQIIRWQSEYGTVPGIANLFPRFGQGSNWFDLISFFNFRISENENFSYANISFVGWFFIWLLSTWKHHSQQLSKSPASSTLAFFYFFLFAYFMIDWQLFRDAANSTNYDFQVTSFMVIIFSFFIEEIIQNKKRETFSPILILFAFTVISFKFSGIFILLLVGYYLFQYKNSKAWLFTMVTGIFVISTVLLRNYITTGYILFPHPLKLNAPDWQVPLGLTTGNYLYILNYNRFFNYWWMIDKVDKGLFNWVPFWVKGILIQHKIVIILSFSLLFWSFAKTSFLINKKQLRFLTAILLTMIVGWFVSAPDPGRFGYCVLLPASILSVSLAIGRFINNIYYYRTALAIMSITVFIYTGKKIYPLLKEPAYLLTPMTTEKPAYTTKTINGVPFNIPVVLKQNWDHRCYYTPLACMCNENPYIQPRGNSLKDGFRMDQPDSIFLKNYSY